MTTFQFDPEVQEYLDLRDVANGVTPRPEGETSEQRYAREARCGELYRTLKASGRFPRLTATAPGFRDGRRYRSGTLFGIS